MRETEDLAGAYRKLTRYCLVMRPTDILLLDLVLQGAKLTGLTCQNCPSLREDGWYFCENPIPSGNNRASLIPQAVSLGSFRMGS